MANGGRIDYTVGFKVDEAGIKNLKQQLDAIQHMSITAVKNNSPFNFNMSDARKALSQAKYAAAQIQNAINGAFDTKTGVMNLQQFNQNLQRLDLETIRQRFNAIGKTGTDAFSNISKAALTTSVKLKNTSSIIDKMGTTLINTLKWTLSSGLINRITGALSQAVGYVEHLDSSLNDIRIVTKKSADEMEVFAEKANKAAQSLGRATTDYTEAALIYYQQGLGDEEVQVRAETTLKAANVTGQAASAVSEQLTAVWNGFKVNAEQTEEYVDKLAAVAAMSASNLEELSTGMSKVASAAANLGVDIDQLTAQISTIVSVTRQAPESVGTALKTIYARISDLKLGGNDEDGLGLGDVSGGLKKLGIEVLDSEGELRDLGTVIEEVAAKWDSWTSAQQAAIAQLMAGKRQYNNLVALFSNWDMYTNAIETSRNATGELQKQQDIYMESAEAHLQQMKTQWEDLYDSILDESAIKGFSDTITVVLKGITGIIDTIGGGKTALLGLVSVITTVFAPQIGKAFGSIKENIANAQYNAAVLKQLLANIQYQNDNNIIGGKAAEAMATAQKEMSQYWHLMSNEQIEASQRDIQELGIWEDKKEAIENATISLKQYYNNSNPNTSTGNGHIGRGKGTLAAEVNSDSLLDPDSAQNRHIQEDLTQTKEKINQAKDSLKSFLKLYESGPNKGSNKFNNFNKELDKIKISFEELQGKGIITEEEYNTTITRLNDIQSKLNKVKKGKLVSFNKDELDGLRDIGKLLDADNEKVQEWIDLLQQGKAKGEEIESFINALKDKLRTDIYAGQFKAENISKMVGGISSIVFSLQSLSGIIDTLNNKDLSLGQKLIQVSSSLLITLPMLYKGVVSLNTARAALGKTTKFLTQQERLLRIGQLSSNASIREKISAYLGLSNVISKKLIVALGGLAIAITTITLLWKGFSSATKDAAEESAKAAEERAKVAEKAYEATQKEQEGINEVIDKYQELSEEYKKTKDINKLREEIYKLAESHQLDLDTITLLTGSYEDLGDALENYRNKVNKENNEAKKANIEAKKQNVYAGNNNAVTQNAGFNLTDIGMLLSSDINSPVTQYMQYDLSTLGYKFDFEKFWEATEEEQQQVTEYLKYEAGWNSDAKEILNQIRSSRATMEEIKKEEEEYNNQVVKSLFEEIFNPDIQEEITNYEEYEAAKDQLAERIASELGIDYEEALEKARKILKESSFNYGNIELANELSKELSNVFNITEKSLAERLSKFSGVELNFIKDNKELASKYKSPEEFLNAFADKLDVLESKEHRINISTAILNSEGKAFKEEDIDKMFANKHFKVNIGVTQEEFKQENFNAQMAQLTNYYYKASQLENDYNNQKKKAHQEEAEQRQAQFIEEQTILEQASQEILEKYGLDGEQAGKYFSENFYNAITGPLFSVGEEVGKELGEVFDSERITDILTRHNDDLINGTNSLTESEEKYLEKLKQETGLDDTRLQKINVQIKAYHDMQKYLKANNKEGKTYSEVVNGITEGLNQANKAAADIDFADMNWDAFKQGVDYLKQATNGAIDNLQSAYSSLTSVMEEYNEAQVLSMDNLQTLLNMDTEYLSALQIENGQMSINEESLKQIALAKLDEAEATAYLQAMDELKNAETRQGIADEAVAQNSLYNLGNAATSAAEAARAGVDDWRAYWNAALNREGVANDAYAQKVGDALRTKLQMIGAVRDQILNGNFSATMKGPSKASASSKSSSEQKPKEEKALERQEDIYREINTELDNIESTLKRIQTIDEHSWGESQKKALQEEQKLLDKQIATLERKQKMQVGDLSTRRKQLEDVGVTFSSDGSVMTNAEGVLNQLYAGYNQMVQRYNNMSAAEQDAYKAQMDTEKNRIDAIEKAIGEYESGYSDLQGTLDELQSKHYEQIETNVREFNHDIDVHLELSDAKKEWNDFWEEVVEDVDDNDFGKKIAGSMKQLENLVGLGGSGSGIVGELTNHLTETVDMVQAQLAAASSGGDGVFEDDTAASHDNLVKYRDELMSALRDAKNEVDEIRENYFNMLDEAQEKMDKQKKGWENIRKQLEHNANLIKLIDGENAYDALNKQYELRHKNNLETIETNKQSAEWWKQRMENAKRVLETTDKNSQEWKDASKEYEVASENYIKNLDDFNQSVEQALEDINEQIELLTNQTFDKLEKDLTNGLGFDVLEEEWKLINDYANSYFDNVERYLNMEEYTNILNDAANAIGLSAENQQKLNEFRDQELDKLRSLNKLTTYDIEESKARLEIMKAQMALEDAQRNKSNLRLRRDSQGNYNYQYVENADAVDEANQGVFSAQKAWYEIVKKQNLQLTEDIMGLRKVYYDYEEKANQAWQDHNIEAYNKYKELASRTFDQIELKQDASEKNKQDLYAGTAQYFAEVDNANIIPQNEATVRTLIDNWASGGEDSFIGAVTLATNRLSEINEEYGRKTKEVLEKAGIDFAGLRNNGLDPTINTLQTLVDTNEDFKDMLDETSDSLAEQERNLRDAEDAYNDLKDAAVGAIEAANNALNQLATTAVSATSQVTAAINAAKQASAITYNTVSPSSSTGGSGSGTGSSNNGSGGSNNSYANNTPYEITISDTAGAHTMRYSAFNKNDIYNVMAPYATGKYMQMWVIKGTNRADLTGSPTKDELRKRINGISFDTGGYTGDWNSNSGRLAMLHQKELILNASDTKNMLSAVEILRSLPIEALAKSIIASSSNIASSFASGVNVSGIAGGVTNNDSKNMVINADFSGVSSADEIYKAFLSLENYGIQQSYSVIPNIN